ncbi:ankyrin [Hypoxylon sp. FL1857]|nr:ankyrin [Hypoxylon sp. FL1857]
MADPLSISASIAGLVTLADVVFLRLMKYVKSAKNAAKETEELAREINVLGGALNSLSRLARSFDDEPADTKKFRMHHIEACSDILTNIQKKLKRFDSDSLKRKVTWPFQSGQVKELLEDLARHKQSVDLALSANSMDLLLRSLAREENLQKATSEILASVEKTREITSRIRRDDDRQKVLKFFLRCNPQQNYEMSLKLRHPRTGLWLLQLPKLQIWLSTANEKLWFTGIPGAGKTVLAGTIIEAALARCNEHVAGAFFFCDYKDEDTHSPVNILSALAYQIAIQKEEAFLILEQCFGDLHPRHSLPRDPTVDGLERVIGQMIKLFDQVFIIVDGIDECGKHVVDILETLCFVSDDSENVSIALLSRDEPDIRDRLEDDFFCERVAAHTEDITEYVTAEIEERIRVGRLRIDDLELKGEIMQGLIDGAAGMFRWVACQLDHLQECVSDKDCREALKKLPPDLNETYLRILKRIPQNRTRLVQLVLHFVAFAFPKLSIEQLRELLSVPEDGGFLEPSGLVRESSIRRLCSSLIRKSNDEECFEFAHFSVQEFLQNESLLKDQFEQFLISKSRCNRLMATHCLRYLQLENFDRHPVATKDEQKYREIRAVNYPLYSYAAENWLRFASREWADEGIVELAKELFSPRKTAKFTSWSIELVVSWKYAYKTTRVFQTDETMSTLVYQLAHEDFTPLHMACLLWLPELCFQLLGEDVDVNHASPFGTLIQCAAGGVFLFSIIDIEANSTPRILASFESHQHNLVLGLPDAAKETLRLILNVGGNRLQNYSNFRQVKRPLTLAIIVSGYIMSFSVVALLIYEGFPLEESHTEILLGVINEWLMRMEGNVAESDFELLVNALNSVINRSPLHRELCSRVWKLAVEQKWSFTLDPCFVDPSVSLSQDMQRQYMIDAVERGNVVMFERIRRSSRLSPADIVDSTGNRLLHLAVANCWEQDDPWAVIETLLKTGCSFSQPDSNGCLPIHCWPRGTFYLEHCESFIKALIDCGVNIDAQDSNGENLLHLSIHDPNCLLAFLKHGSEASTALALRTIDREGYTPFSMALENGLTKSASILFEKGGNDSRTWQSPISALLLAVGENSEEIFRAMISAGETITQVEGETLTPLHYVGAATSIGFVNYLKSLYPGACNVRINDETPLDIYLDRSFQSTNWVIASIDPEIIAALYPVEFQGDEGKLVWEHFANTIIKARRNRPRRFFPEKSEVEKMCHKAINMLVQLGCLTSYENSSRKPAVLLLSPTAEDSFEGLQSLRPVTSQIICDLSNNLDRWPGFQTSPSIVRLLKAAVMSNRDEVVALLLQKHVSAHQRVETYSALEVACRLEVWVKTFRLLLEYADKRLLDETNPAANGLGLIHRLAIPRATDKVTELLQRGADPDLRTSLDQNYPALMYHLRQGQIESSITLLEKGANPTKTNRIGVDACHAAALEGATDFLIRVHGMKTAPWQPSWKKLINYRVQIGRSMDGIIGCNALHLASISGNVDCLRFYLDHNIFSDVNTASNQSFTPLHCAALAERVDAIKFLHRQGANINALTDLGHLPLHFAVMNQQLGAVETLLELGGEVTEDCQGMSPYLHACQLGNQLIIDCFRDKHHSFTLIKSTNERIVGSSTEKQLGLAIALENAIKGGNITLCEELRQNGCHLDIDMPSCKGCSPLHLAIRFRKSEIIRWLLAQGASTLKISCQRCGGWRPIYAMLVDRDLTTLLKEFLGKYLDDGGKLLGEAFGPVCAVVERGNVGGLRILLEHIRQNAQHYTQMVGEQPENVVSIAVNKVSIAISKPSPLHVAALHGFFEIVKCLLENGASVYALNQALQTPLHDATRSKAHSAHKVAEVLISHGADLDCRDQNGCTPLMMACRSGRSDIVEVLLNAGANPHILDNFSQTALFMLANRQSLQLGHRVIFFRLLALGLNLHLEISKGISPIQLAMHHYQFSNIILNGDYGVQNMAPFPWNRAIITNCSWLITTFRMFRRKIPLGDLQKIANTEPSGCWSPLCLSASQGMLETMENLLTLGASMDFEGCPEGTALMAACRFGRLESVILLVRRGATLSYHGPHGFRTALHESRTPKHILQWLLVTRFTDQGKIMDTPDDGSSSGPAFLRPWSGITKAELVLCESLERRPDQSSKQYWIHLMDQKKKWRGKIVPVGDRRRTVRPSKLIPEERVRIHPDGYEIPKPVRSARIEAGMRIQGWRSPN